MSPSNPSSQGFSFQHNTVKVQNIPLHINQCDVIALFSALIGDVRGSADIRSVCGNYLEISFFTADVAKKALCMSGYTIEGKPLIVTAMEAPLALSSSTISSDNRRNLYVVGLPYDLTKSELTGIFARHGTVSHCVILATVDNASRRRGFVVMATHEDANKAMMAVTRRQIRGHNIDISWAIVQRSQGFLDGGDRTVFFDPRHSRSTSPDSSPGDQPYRSANSSDTSSRSRQSQPEKTPLVPSLFPSPVILISHLPKMLFAQALDLEPLLYPFGAVKKLEVLGSSQAFTSVLVEYTSVRNAKDAKDYLHGQRYVDSKVDVKYIRVPTLPVLQDLDGDGFPAVSDMHDSDSFADKFHFSATNMHSNSMFHSSQDGDKKFNIMPRQRFPQSHRLYPRAPSRVDSCLMSRSSSTTSMWSNEPQQNFSSVPFPNYHYHGPGYNFSRGPPVTAYYH